MKTHYEVIIIGAGPAGIGAATALEKAGIHDYIVLEREAAVGGVPRHCHHPSFGIKTHYYPMTGPHYIQKILSGLSLEKFVTQATVIAIQPKGHLEISTPHGIITVYGKRIILATGARETPRHPRLVSGLRPQGILTTGALQQLIYLQNLKPCRAPVIVGTEVVSFSALWTLRAAGIKTKAMLESYSRPLAWRASALLPTVLGTSIHYHTKISEIGGLKRVEYIEFENILTGEKQQIMCDSVIFTGKFVGEYTLIRHSHLAQLPQTGCPITDQFGRCSDDSYFATGNMLHPVETGEQCFLEGRRIGENVAHALQGHLPVMRQRIPIISKDSRLRVVFPSCLSGIKEAQTLTLRLRTAGYIRGELIVRSGVEVLSRTKVHQLPERGITVKNITIPTATESLEVDII